MRNSANIGLFLGSYAPLFLLLSLTQLNNGVAGNIVVCGVSCNILPVAFMLMTMFGIAYILVFMKIAQTIAPISITPSSVERHSQETLAYLITYLIPFVGFTFSEVNYLVANALILVLIGILYIQSGMVFLNPTLSLFGYKVYRLHYSEHTTLMLAKTMPKPQNKVRVIIINQGICIEPKR